MPKFHLYVVHTASLIHRPTRLHGTIQSIREIATGKGYEFRSVIVLTPDTGSLQAKIQQVSDRVKYEKTGFDDLDAQTTILNLEEISNYEKHREVWRRIQKEAAPEDVCFVIEDDAIIVPDFTKNLSSFIENPNKDKWDFYALSVSIQSDRRTSNIAETMRILVSKCAYAVRPSITQVLLDETEIIRFSMRYQLSYVFLKRKDTITALVSNQQCIMEGSKLGIFPSSTHPNNVLIFNQEFMELFNIARSESIDLGVASSIYERVKHIQNPDIAQLYAIILFKCGKVKEASDLFNTAVEWMQKQHGLLNAQSDLLNNSINIYEHMQWDLPEYLNTPSKYDSILEQAPPLQG